jgi:hypothetical protein
LLKGFNTSILLAANFLNLHKTIENYSAMEI